MRENKDKKEIKKVQENVRNKNVGKNRAKVSSRKKIETSPKGSKKKLDKFKAFVKENKNTLLVSILLIIDVILIICFARDNYANFANVDGKVIFVGKTKNLLFGRNYVGLIVTCFIYFYGILTSKVLCKNKFTLKKLVLLFIFIFVLNVLLFYGFTNKIY